MEKLDWQRTVQAALNSVYSLGEVVNAFTPEQYAQAPVQFLSSGVGGHVRHCLNHVDALLNGLTSGTVDYETRARGTGVESCKHKALAALQRTAQKGFEFLQHESAERVLQVVQFLDTQGTRVLVTSTLARELSFVASHTVHHQAMIFVVSKLLQVHLPQNCGLAPSTAVFLKAGHKCAL